MRLLLAMKKFICRGAYYSRKIVYEPFASYLGVPKLLAILKTSCETYAGKAVSRELFFPSVDFMEANIHMAGIMMSASWWSGRGRHRHMAMPIRHQPLDRACLTNIWKTT